MPRMYVVERKIQISFPGPFPLQKKESWGRSTSLQKHHPSGMLLSCNDQLANVHTAFEIARIEGDGVRSGFLRFVHQRRHNATMYVEDTQENISIFRNSVCDRGRWVEGVGEVLGEENVLSA